jgi:hypothetical protein
MSLWQILLISLRSVSLYHLKPITRFGPYGWAVRPFPHLWAGRAVPICVSGAVGAALIRHRLPCYGAYRPAVGSLPPHPRRSTGERSKALQGEVLVPLPGRYVSTSETRQLVEFLAVRPSRTYSAPYTPQPASLNARHVSLGAAHTLGPVKSGVLETMICPRGRVDALAAHNELSTNNSSHQEGTSRNQFFAWKLDLALLMSIKRFGDAKA